MSSLGGRLKRFREAANLTQRQVANTLDVTVLTVQHWESGKHTPKLSPYQTKLLCDLLKVTLEDLVRED